MAAILLLALGCGEPEAPAPAPASAPVPAPAPAPAPAPTPAPTPAPQADGEFLARPVSGLLRRMRESRFVRARELGGISISFKVELEGGEKCSFKPEIRGQRQKWQGEVAAWRIARLLGLGGDLPPSESRRVHRDELLRALEDDERTRAARERLASAATWDDGGRVVGSVTWWIPQLQPRPLEREAEQTTWRPWLKQGGAMPDEASRPLATQLSRLLTFDQVIGNWDRFSGGGFLATRDGARLFFLDHNAAFYRPMPAEAAERLESHFAMVERFSRSLVERLRRLDAASVRAELERDGGGHPILSDEQIADLLARRDAVLANVDAFARARGEDAVLAYP